MEEFLACKQAGHAAYRERLSGLDWGELLPEPPYARNNLWMYPWYVRDGRWRGRARDLVEALREYGIESRPLWELCHRQPPYRGCRALSTERAADLVANVVNLPCSTGLRPEQIDRVGEALARV
mgnify:FL=1